MWEQRNSLYAAPVDEEKVPFTRRARTPWQRLKSWVRERPLLSALIAIIVVGGIVAVIAGPVASSQHKDKEKENQIVVEGIDFRMTFEAQNAAQICSNFTDVNFLSGYAATLQTSIASILSLQTSQVALDYVECGSKSYYLNSGSRRLLTTGSAESDVSIVVTFRLLSSGNSGDSSSTPSSGNGSGSVEKLPQPAAAASQLQSSSPVLQEAVSKALGLPSGNVVLVSVVTGQQGGAATAPPLASPPSPSPLPALQLSPSLPDVSPPPVAEFSSPPPLAPDAVPAIYSSTPPSSPAPVYGLDASTPPSPPPSAVYGATN